MKAVGLLKYLPIEHEESLIDIELAKPKAINTELLVKINAISVNPIDTKQRAPKDRVEENYRILGWDVSGVVEEVGEECKDFQVGDEVFYSGSVSRQGCYSEYQLVDEKLVGKKPKNLNHTEAAALPLTALTAYEAMFEQLGINPNTKEENKGKNILIIGGAGGVGSIAIQLAKYAGLTVLTTASREETAQWVTNFGADYVFNHRYSLTEQIVNSPVKQVDYILNLNDTDYYFLTMAELIKPFGKICCLVDNKEPVDLKILKSKSVTFTWEFMFTRPMYGTNDMYKHQKYLNEISELLDNQIIKTTLHTTLSPINAKTLKKAHAMLETNRTIGKIVLEGF